MRACLFTKPHFSGTQKLEQPTQAGEQHKHKNQTTTTITNKGTKKTREANFQDKTKPKREEPEKHGVTVLRLNKGRTDLHREEPKRKGRWTRSRRGGATTMSHRSPLFSNPSPQTSRDMKTPKPRDPLNHRKQPPANRRSDRRKPYKLKSTTYSI